MATLEKRVQVLFDTELYARLEAEARTERTSVGAVIREAVQTRLDHRRADAQAALERLFARADAHPTSEPLDWENTKDDLLDSPVLGDIS